MVDEGEREAKREAEEVKQLLGVVSTEVPALIKSLLASVFSEEAGRNMGKAAAAYYKELKTGGLPEEVAVKLTEDYMRTFTSIGDMLRGSMRAGRHADKGDDVMGEAIEKRIREKLEKRNRASEAEDNE